MPISRNIHDSLKKAAMQVVLPTPPVPEPLNEEVTDTQENTPTKFSLAEQYISDIIDGSLNESLNEDETDVYVETAVNYIFDLALQLDEMLNKTE